MENSNSLTPEKSVQILGEIYQKALTGVFGSDSVETLARDYLSQKGTLEEKVDSLINWQVAKYGTTGFITSLGGVLTLPIAIPADMGVNWYIQMRMAAAIAYMGGHDIYKDQVQTFVYAALCGSTAVDMLRPVGIRIGEELAKSFIQRGISSEVLKKINQAVGFKLVTKASEKGVINLSKAVPIVGGIVGATFDAVTTKTIGKMAKKIFIN